MSPDRRIENLIYRYAEAIDAGDFEGVASLFRHAVILAPQHDGRTEGYDAVLAMYEGSTRRYEDGTPKTKHLTSNVIIDMDGDTSASARSYFTVIQATEKLPLQPIISGRYHDRFECVDGRWRFCERQMFVDLMGDLSQHLLFDGADLAD